MKDTVQTMKTETSGWTWWEEFNFYEWYVDHFYL